MAHIIMMGKISPGTTPTKPAALLLNPQEVRTLPFSISLCSVIITEQFRPIWGGHGENMTAQIFVRAFYMIISKCIMYQNII